ncbi:MAG: septum formation initiator family protein [Bacteroidota bacterium]|nr:septum formation initiator family protein [Candidatus Kapabacteria bacterium]MDW8219975.1 septum formation initiator family protein [Bacteroidota bacterium]
MTTTVPPSSLSQRLIERRWAILAWLAFAALTVVLFVNNAIRVGKLAVEIELLKREHQQLVHQNEVLRSTIIRLESPERITVVAQTRLGMVSASSAPVRIPAASTRREP